MREKENDSRRRTSDLSLVEEKQTSSTPYDDVFRTMTVDCPKLVLPLINEMFAKTGCLTEQYRGDEVVVSLGNEHFTMQEGGEQEKRITDSLLEVRGKTTKKFHLECQSTEDGNIIVRMFEYDAQIALQNRNLEKGELRVRFPNSGVLYLRSTEKTPDALRIRIQTSEGEAKHTIPVLKLRRYNVNELFEKRLYMLIPFYLFNLEHLFRKCDRKDAEALEFLRDTYREIAELLLAALEEKRIDERELGLITDMLKKVTRALARKHRSVREEVETIMGGKVLDYPSKRAYNAGLDRGREEGHHNGYLEALFSLVKDGILSISDAGRRVDMTEEAFRERMTLQ